MSRAVEEYLKPDVVQQIARLDLRAKFIVKGFLQGLHASPFQGFSVEFSEHRRYAAGDDPKDIDWLIYAKTDNIFTKNFSTIITTQYHWPQLFAGSWFINRTPVA